MSPRCQCPAKGGMRIISGSKGRKVGSVRCTVEDEILEVNAQAMVAADRLAISLTLSKPHHHSLADALSETLELLVGGDSASERDRWWPMGWRGVALLVFKLSGEACTVYTVHRDVP